MKPHKIYATDLDSATLDQFYSALDQDFSVRGALMPDAHLGYSLPIGAVVATAGVILPSWVGYDIGCGMCAVATSFTSNQVHQQAQQIFAGIYRAVPVGFSHNRRNTPWDYNHIPRTPLVNALLAKNGMKQLGSLGSGNHFIEIGIDEHQKVWIIIHSGSRNLGHCVAAHYMKLAGGGKAREGHFGFAVNSQQGCHYIKDLNFCLQFALQNRLEILRRVVEEIQRHCHGNADWQELINRNHNHAEEKDGLWIHRKGATHAEQGMRGVIPGNMRDGSFIVVGKGNPQALWSSSHGAGRALGRKQAKKQITMKQFNDSMRGIVAHIDHTTLDEAPSAYKDLDAVMALQKDLVTICHRIRPLINIKG